MSITKLEDGSIIVEGPEDTRRYQLIAWYVLLKRPAPKGSPFAQKQNQALRAVKQTFNLTGNREQVVLQYRELLHNQGIPVR